MGLKTLLWNDNTARLLQDTSKALQSGAGALSSLMDATARRSAQSMDQKSSGEGWEKLLQGGSTTSSHEEEDERHDGWRNGHSGYGYYFGNWRIDDDDD